MKLQRLLKALDFDLGKFGPNKDGIDGDFEGKTFEAVKEFQDDEGHKDWEGKTLTEDELVGPRTSDALNRALVGVSYDFYQTDTQLTDGKKIITVSSSLLSNSGLELENPQPGEEIEVILRGDVPLVTTLKMRLIDDLDQPIQAVQYRLEVGQDSFEGKTNDLGLLQHHIAADSESGKLILNTWTVDLIISKLDPPDQVDGAQARLNNLGLFASEEINGQLDDRTKRAIERFQSSHTPLKISGQLDQETAKKLEEVYGA